MKLGEVVEVEETEIRINPIQLPAPAEPFEDPDAIPGLEPIITPAEEPIELPIVAPEIFTPRRVTVGQ